MKVFLVEANPDDIDRIRDRWVFRRAVVVSINEESAIQCVLQGLHGHEVFSGFKDAGRYARPQDEGYFNSNTCSVTLLAIETRERAAEQRRSRIIVWELCPPEVSSSENDDLDP